MKLKTPLATKILGALALVVVAGLGWLFVLGPQTAALTDVRTQTTAARDQSAALSLQLTTLKKQQEQLPQTRAASAALTAKFPATADQPGLFEAVTKAVSDAGIPSENLTALTPTPPVVGTGDETAAVPLPTVSDPAANLATQTVTVSVEGTYDQTRRLLANLEQMSRAYLVTSLTVTAGAADATLDPGAVTDQFATTITGQMYVMPLAEDLDPEPAEDTSDGN